MTPTIPRFLRALWAELELCRPPWYVLSKTLFIGHNITQGTAENIKPPAHHRVEPDLADLQQWYTECLTNPSMMEKLTHVRIVLR